MKNRRMPYVADAAREYQAVLDALKQLEKTSFANGARVRVREVDFSTLSFEDQIAIDATTDVLIGPHGAGLMHNVSDTPLLLRGSYPAFLHIFQSNVSPPSLPRLLFRCSCRTVLLLSSCLSMALPQTGTSTTSLFGPGTTTKANPNLTPSTRQRSSRWQSLLSSGWI